MTTPTKNNFFTNLTKSKKGIIAIIVVGTIFLCCIITLIIGLIQNSTPEGRATSTAKAEVQQVTQTEKARPTNTQIPLNTPAPSNTPLPTNTPKPTSTPAPTNTPFPPTATTNPNIIKPGTYLVGTEIKPGLYIGKTGTSFSDSCYWQLLKDFSGSLDAIIANDNSIGQYYIGVSDTDYALQTACELLYLSSLPEPLSQFPTTIEPGMYLVGIDIQPGTYKGQAGADFSDSCYWERLTDLSGDLYSIIANDNAVGQYYVQISQNDFALTTSCELERVGD